ncbi:M23 family metallopeptidase [Actinotalea sp. BY-33]|uniref:M23 family metallopeptidase n=1 Tax=Actinotalea soli TaxID=2819234 RepID=A0A939LNU9_9CELL|nr:M23 family metallopeptidase [Actinotalea soli]MBO1751932.1 M23 family metallopeptidase [Actinotalea soli]
MSAAHVSIPRHARLATVAMNPVLMVLGLVAVVAGPFLDVPWAPLLPLAGVLLIALYLAATFLPRRLEVPVLLLDSPVQGPWEALNSPTTKTPSHGTHGYGQTYAVDLVHTPADPSRPTFGQGPAMRPPTDYPAFDRPVHAVADAVVARTSDRYRDHRSRSSWLAVVFMMAEGMVRELGGPGPVLGNHVVLRLADGTHAVYAHLRRGSLEVSTGQEVRAGQVIARCGNSGNSSEPHLHVQRCDAARVSRAVGLPWAVRGGRPDGTDGLPADGEVLDGRPADPQATRP